MLSTALWAEAVFFMKIMCAEGYEEDEVQQGQLETFLNYSWL